MPASKQNAAVGYSGTPLVAKLGIREGSRVCALGAPPDYREWLNPLPAGVTFPPRLSAAVDLVHVFSTSRADLAVQLKRLRGSLNASAVLWVSWPKKSSKVATDVTEDVIRALALPLGFVDVKVCAVTDVWSGLKLVVRKELR